MKKAFAYFLSLILVCVSAHSASLVEMAKDTQWNMQTAEGRIQFIWLMSTAYWNESFKSGGVSDSERQKMIDVLDKFNVIAVIDASVGVAGLPSGLDEMAIRDKLAIRGVDGGVLAPIVSEKQDQELRALLNLLKPAMANMMGAFGSQMQFLVYPGFDQKGKRVFDFEADGLIKFEYDQKALSARTPLSSTLTKKQDHETGEIFPGNFQFNPYTGKELK